MAGSAASAAPPGRYKGDRAFFAYRRYCKYGGGVRLRRAYEQLLPSIKRYGYNDPQLVQAVADAVFLRVRRRRFPTNAASSFFSYMRKTAFTAVTQERLRERRETANTVPIDPEVLDKDYAPAGSMDTLEAVERKIMIERVPVAVAEHVAKRIRFAGVERQACVHILSRLICGEDVPIRGLAVLFELDTKRLRFLYDYVVVRMRLALYALRAEVRAACPIRSSNQSGWLGMMSYSRWLSMPGVEAPTA